jgi:hypothetical protein
LSNDRSAFESERERDAIATFLQEGDEPDFAENGHPVSDKELAREEARPGQLLACPSVLRHEVGIVPPSGAPPKLVLRETVSPNKRDTFGHDGAGFSSTIGAD